MNRASASPPASTRARGAGARALGLTALALATGACTLSQNGVVPPSDTFFYPTSAVMSPTDPAGQFLYVANSNADLRFNDGTLVMVDVAKAHDDRFLNAGSRGAAPRRTTLIRCPATFLRLAAGIFWTPTFSIVTSARTSNPTRRC